MRYMQPADSHGALSNNRPTTEQSHNAFMDNIRKRIAQLEANLANQINTGYSPQQLKNIIAQYKKTDHDKYVDVYRAAVELYKYYNQQDKVYNRNSAGKNNTWSDSNINMYDYAAAILKAYGVDAKQNLTNPYSIMSDAVAQEHNGLNNNNTNTRGIFGLGDSLKAYDEENKQFKVNTEAACKGTDGRLIYNTMYAIREAAMRMMKVMDATPDTQRYKSQLDYLEQCMQDYANQFKRLASHANELANTKPDQYAVYLQMFITRPMNTLDNETREYIQGLITQYKQMATNASNTQSMSNVTDYANKLKAQSDIIINNAANKFNAKQNAGPK